MRSIAADLATTAGIALEVDASAAIGIVNRQGLGNTRHIDVRGLWLQDKVRSKEIAIFKVPGDANTADIGTKALAAEVIQKHIRQMGFFNMMRWINLVTAQR